MSLLKRKNKKERNRYTSFEEIIKDIESLKDWKKERYSKTFLKFLSKISVLVKGYQYIDENGKNVEGTYPSEVFEAIAKICTESGKFPREENLYQAHTREDINYVEKLLLVTSKVGLIGLYEETDISEIANNQFGINIDKEPASKNEVNQLIKSCYEFLDKSKAKEYFKILYPKCDMKHLNVEQKNEIDFLLQHLDEIDNAISCVSDELSDYSLEFMPSDKVILERALNLMGKDLQVKNSKNNGLFSRKAIKNALFNKRIQADDIIKISDDHRNKGETEIVE